MTAPDDSLTPAPDSSATPAPDVDFLAALVGDFEIPQDLMADFADLDAAVAEAACPVHGDPTDVEDCPDCVAEAQVVELAGGFRCTYNYRHEGGVEPEDPNDCPPSGFHYFSVSRGARTVMLIFRTELSSYEVPDPDGESEEMVTIYGEDVAPWFLGFRHPSTPAAFDAERRITPALSIEGESQQHTQASEMIQAWARCDQEPEPVFLALLALLVADAEVRKL